MDELVEEEEEEEDVPRTTLRMAARHMRQQTMKLLTRM